MALKATVFKAEIQIADMDRTYYHTHALTLARHPSETDERLMVRLVAFALYADDSLSFSKGLSTDDEPDLWKMNLQGEIDLWIELGQADEKRIRRASGKARKVVIVCYNKRASPVWWQQISPQLQRYDNLSVIMLEYSSSASLTAMTRRNMQLNCSIQDHECWLSDSESGTRIAVNSLKPFATAR